MRTLPTRKCVRRKALVHQAQRAGDVGIGKLFVEIRDLRSEQQSLINNGAARERGNVKDTRVFDVRQSHLALGALADDVELAFKLVFVGERTTAHEDLLDVRL